MTRIVSEAFDVLLQRLRPTETETVAAATHRAGIEARLQADFGMTRLFRSGSFGHGTSVGGFSDIDYFAVIPRTILSNSSNYTLQQLRLSLLKRFPLTNIAVRSPAVVVPFGGGGAGERHEITPTYTDGQKDGATLYAIPNRSDGWMHSSPTAHAAWVNQVNEKHGKRVKALIRLVKYWNYLAGAGIRSFYIEMRVAEYANGETSISYPIDVKRALIHMHSKGLAAMQDPKSLVGYFYPCTDAAKPDALSRLSTAVTRAEKALDAERAGKQAEAFDWWDKLYLGKFPAYY